MAGVVTIDVSACLNTNNLSTHPLNQEELKKYPLERCPDKNSFLMLSVKSEYMKELSLEDINKVSFCAPTVPPLVLDRSEAASIQKKPQNRSVDRKALKEKLGIGENRFIQTDRPRPSTVEMPIPVPDQALSQIVSSAGSAKALHVDDRNSKPSQPPAPTTLREGIRALENIVSRQQQTETPNRQQDKLSVQSSNRNYGLTNLSAHSTRQRNKAEQTTVTANINTSSVKYPSPEKLAHEQWLTRVHENALSRKSELMESSLREEIVKLKSICQSLDQELNSEHVFRIKLEAELQHSRVENLQLKQIQKNLQKEIAALRPIEQEGAIRNMRRNLDKLQLDNSEKTKRIEILEQEVLNFTNVKLELAKKIQELAASNSPIGEGRTKRLLSSCKGLFNLSVVPGKAEKIASFGKQVAERQTPTKETNVHHRTQSVAEGNPQEPHRESLELIEELKRLQLENKQLFEHRTLLEMKQHHQELSIRNFQESTRLLTNELEQKSHRIECLEEELETLRDILNKLGSKRQVQEDLAEQNLNILTIQVGETVPIDSPIRAIQESNQGLYPGKQRLEDYPTTAVSQLVEQTVEPTTETDKPLEMVIKTSLEQSTINFQAEQLETLRQKIEELQQEAVDRTLIIKFLEGKKDRLEANLHYFQQQNSHLQAVVKEQLKKSIRADREVEELRNQNSNCTIAVRSLSEQLLVKSVSNMECFVDQRSPQLRSEFSQQRKNYDSPLLRPSASRPPAVVTPNNQSEKLQKEVMKFKTELHQTESSLEQQCRKIDELNSMIDIQNREIVQKQVEIQELTERNELLERSVKKFVGQIDGLERAVIDYRGKIARCEGLMIETQKKNQIQQSSNKQQITTLQQTNEGLVKIVRMYEETIHDRQTQIVVLEEKLKESQEQKMEYSRQATRYRKSLDLIDRQLESDKIRPITFERNSGSPNQSDLQLEIGQLQEILTTLTRKHKELHGSMDSMRYGFEKLARELSLELNKIKVKLLNSASINMDSKKQFIASLRPIQLKIEDILNFSDRRDDANCSDSQNNGDPITQQSEKNPS